MKEKAKALNHDKELMRNLLPSLSNPGGKTIFGFEELWPRLCAGIEEVLAQQLAQGPWNVGINCSLIGPSEERFEPSGIEIIAYFSLGKVFLFSALGLSRSR